jgi:hypothetical protein
MTLRSELHIAKKQEPADPARNIVFLIEDLIWLDVNALGKRGWTEFLLITFLGGPDRWRAVNHYRNFYGKRAYFLPRVEKAERSSQFATAFGFSAKRRKFDEDMIAEIAANRSNGTIEGCLNFRAANRNNSIGFWLNGSEHQAMLELANDVLRPRMVSKDRVTYERALSD